VIYLYLITIFGLFLGHLVCELLTIFSRYNYAALSKHMAGAAVANYFAIASRGFVSLYAILVAYLVERLELNLTAYSLCVSFALVVAGVFSIVLSKSILLMQGGKTILLHQNRRGNLHVDYSDEAPAINFLLVLVLGVQFVAMSLAYALCMVFTENRLLIISIAPALSMLGTVAAAVFIEPRFAKYVDRVPAHGYGVSSRYLTARAISFFLSALAFSTLTVLDF
jgi:hypothetical protein